MICDKILIAKYLFHHRTHAMDIFIANLHED